MLLQRRLLRGIGRQVLLNRSADAGEPLAKDLRRHLRLLDVVEIQVELDLLRVRRSRRGRSSATSSISSAVSPIGLVVEVDVELDLLGVGLGRLPLRGGRASLAARLLLDPRLQLGEAGVLVVAQALDAELEYPALALALEGVTRLESGQQLLASSDGISRGSLSLSISTSARSLTLSILL